MKKNQWVSSLGLGSVSPKRSLLRIPRMCSNATSIATVIRKVVGRWCREFSRCNASRKISASLRETLNVSSVRVTALFIKCNSLE